MREAAHNFRRSAFFFVAALALSLTVTPGCSKEAPQPPQPEPSPAPSVTAAPTPDATPRLHAWANPITIGGLRFADHTWVTTYQAPSHCPPLPNFWYSWGGCHGSGPDTAARALGNQAADLAAARCICAPDLEDYLPTPDNPAHGGIDIYGISGVCHQLSNRILWATRGGGAAPIIVSDALGYGVSRFLYGTYGVNAAEWGARVLRCTAPIPPSPAPGTPVAAAMAVAHTYNFDADLAAMLDGRLGKEFPRAKAVRIQQVRARLLLAKAPLDRAVRSGELPPARFANDVNDLVNQHLRDAAEILTPVEYERLFGLPKGVRIGIVDPTIAERSNYRPR